jgi:hypothetical protein
VNGRKRMSNVRPDGLFGALNAVLPNRGASMESVLVAKAGNGLWGGVRGVAGFAAM